LLPQNRSFTQAFYTMRNFWAAVAKPDFGTIATIDRSVELVRGLLSTDFVTDAGNVLLSANIALSFVQIDDC